MTDPHPVILAATVVLLRDVPGTVEGGSFGGGSLEVLMLHRTSKVAFGGMWVFPGGRVEDGDRHPDDPPDLEQAVEAAAQRAAIREASEECGLDVDPHAVVALSRWTPPAVTPRRFATWFFVARVPEGEVVVDGGEILDHLWLAPADVLARRDRGEIDLAPPTWVTLHDLVGLADVDAVLAMARSRRPVPHYETRWSKVEGGAVALWAGDAGYATSSVHAEGARHRLWMVAEGWRLERT
ncbi:MAG: NUDIX hydrolase [Acidimicrobiales bacterium]|nr:NUDIX hydrolase [Acidimicrobiales bacterium]